MYDNFFYDHTCTIYSLWTAKVNWAEKESKSAIYSDIPCTLRSISSNNLNDSNIWRKTDTATHKININWQYNLVEIGMLVFIDDREYIIVDWVTYTDINNTDDNKSFYIRVR